MRWDRLLRWTAAAVLTASGLAHPIVASAHEGADGAPPVPGERLEPKGEH
jgi:hypothetical protein